MNFMFLLLLPFNISVNITLLDISLVFEFLDLVSEFRRALEF